MTLEFYVADVVDDQKIKMDAMHMNIINIIKYVFNKEAWYHYAIGEIITLVVILIVFVLRLTV